MHFLSLEIIDKSIISSTQHIKENAVKGSIMGPGTTDVYQSQCGIVAKKYE